MPPSATRRQPWIRFCAQRPPGRRYHVAATLTLYEDYEVPPSPTSAIQYRPLQEADLPQAHALSAALQWPHRLEDWRFGWRLGAGEAAWHGADLAGVALHWDYGTCMTLGHIIVAPAHQGQGIGGTLVARALRHAAAPAALLHATPAGAGVYARQGFGVVGQVAQHQGVVPAQLPAAGPLPAGVALRPLAPGDRAWAMAWDTAATGMRREALLGALWDTAQGVVLMRAGQPAGFSLLRRAGRGWVVGPLVAPDLDGAQAMVRHWLAGRPGEFLRVDTGADSGLGPWLARHGLPRVDFGAIMSRGPMPARDSRRRAYALVSQALG